MGSSPGRLRRLAAAWLATAAMLFASAGSLFGHAAVDRECAPALAAAHDHNAHRITSPVDEAPEHCGACHLTRTVRETASTHPLVRTGGLELVLRAASSSLSLAELSPDLTRGPPSIA
jgi:hypothetical protein